MIDKNMSSNHVTYTSFDPSASISIEGRTIGKVAGNCKVSFKN